MFETEKELKVMELLKEKNETG